MLGIIAKVLNVSLEGLLGVEESENPITGDFDSVSMAKAIADYRKHNGLSQSELAEKLSVTPDAVSKWERGVTMPDIDSLISLANLFAVCPSLLYYGVKAEEKIEAPVFYTKSASKKWMIFSIVTCALFVASIICAVIFFPWPEEKIYHVVSVEGVGEFEVENNTLFFQSEPEKLGYKFVKWVNEQGEEVQTPCVVMGDLNIFPVFEAVEYTVDYWLNGGIVLGATQTTFTVEQAEITLPIPEKQNQTFEGWYLTADYSGDAVTSVTCNAKNVVLYAKWSDEVYSIRYFLNGGSVNENPYEVDKNNVYALNSPHKAGYLFLGWYDNADGGNKYEYVGGENACNLSLYAKWQKTEKSYVLTYHLNGSTLESANPESIVSGESIKLNQPYKFGHRFLGWYDNADGQGAPYVWVTGEKDLELYALFIPQEYVIVYHYEGYYVDEVNKTHVTFGESFNLAPVVREGYEFLGWFDAQENGNKVEEINENVTYITDLYAIFNPKTYDINLDASGGEFELNGQTGAEGVINYKYGTVFELPICYKEGYEFDYWKGENGFAYSQITTLNCYLQEFTAVYTYVAGTTIDYQLQGGSIVGEYPEKAFKGQVEELPTPVRYGYKFIGWNLQEDGKGDYYSTTEGLTFGETVAIFAIWEEVIIIGSAEDFSYAKSATQVTLRYYIGKTGEDIDLIIPSFIDGLPVTEIGPGFLMDEANQPPKYFNSIVLPSTLRVIKSSGFILAKLNEPLIIPKSVHTIEEDAFWGEFASIQFEEGSALKTLTYRAFHNVITYDIFELPEGLEEIQSSSLPATCFGLKLPQSLKRVESLAFGHTGDKGYQYMNIYLPKGVTEVGKLAFSKAKIYTDASPETVASYDKDWCVSYSNASEYTLTLKDGDTVLNQSTGICFNLPVLSKPGYNFIGWVDENGKSVCKSYINTNFIGVTLFAHFEKASKTDGTSYETAIVFDGREPMTLTIGLSKTFYVLVDDSFWFFEPRVELYKNVETSSRFKYRYEEKEGYMNSALFTFSSSHPITAQSLGKIIEIKIVDFNGYTMSQTFTFFGREIEE